MKTKEAAETLRIFFDSPLEAVSSALRGFLIPSEGCEFIGADFSSIEARVLAWLAGEEKVLQIFRGDGKIYEKAASDIYKVSVSQVTKQQRQIGKVAVLALGYGGGKGAFQQMANGYGVKVSEEEAEQIKTAWRWANPNIVSFWYALEAAAMDAIKTPNTKIKVGRYIQFRTAGSFLWCQLPSGRLLSYPYPKIEKIVTPWGAEKEGVTYMTEAPPSNKWMRIKTYGGSLSENVTQAVARDVLAEALIRVDAAGFDIVTHIHDEILTEAPKGTRSVEDLEKLMCVAPEWAAGLPVNAEGWSGSRYKK